MSIEPISPFKIDHEIHVDEYLEDLLKKPENRSMDVVYQHAKRVTENGPFRVYFIEKAREILKGFGHAIK